jgi:glycosyltransferase involved in cell wall biosynthesis
MALSSTRVPRTSNDDVTIVISCFNYGAFLSEAIASAAGQDGGPPRVVVVDDGSTDEETIRALDEIDRQGPVELIRQENAGASAARNAGLARVETAYALVLDADDVLPPDALTRLREALERDPSAGYAYGHIEYFGNQSGVMRMPPFDPWRLLFRHIVGPTALMRTELVRATGGYDVTFRHYEDWEIWLHSLALGWNGRQVDFTGLLQRKHGPSKFATDRARYHEYFERLRVKHQSLYGHLPRVAGDSSLGPVERALYRWVWGRRPWPAAAEAALYSLLWRGSSDAGASSTSRTAR